MNAMGRNLKRTLVLALLMILLGPRVRAGSPQGRPDPFAEVREKIASAIKAKKIPSLSLAVVKDGEIVWEEAFGLADLQKNINATPETLYPIASATKPITAAGLMILVERGVVELDKPVNFYLKKEQIRSGQGDPSGATVRRVLQHTSGLPMYWSFSFGGTSRPRAAIETTIRRYARLVSMPGESYNYSNLGYGVLEYLIEQVSGRPHPEFLAAEVFGPLNMKHTEVRSAPPPGPNVATKYSSALAPIPFCDQDTRGAGAVYSTARDLALFALLYLGRLQPGQKSILRPESIAAMLRTRDPDVRSSSYALGWETGQRNGYPIVTHGGIMDGCRAHVAMIPSEGLAAVVLINGENVRSIEVCDWIFAALLPKYARWMKAASQGPSGLPAAPASFNPPPELIATWDGTIQTHEGNIPVSLHIDPSGEVELFRPDERGAPGKGLSPLKTPTLNRGIFVVHFPQVFSTSDATASDHRTVLGLTIRKDRLTGEANLIASDMSYSLPSYVELKRAVPKRAPAFTQAGPIERGTRGPVDQAFKEFEAELERQRRQLRIPGMAAGVVKDQRLVWAKGFGYADLENRIPASTSTPWHIASVTKTFAAVILLQLVEEGKLRLDDPLPKFGIRMKSRGIVRVRHILTHTAESKPGTFFRYSGRLWEHLSTVIQQSSGRSFKELLVERIIRPLELVDSAPNREAESNPDPFEEVLKRAAVPYTMDAKFAPRRSDYGLGFYAAGGLFVSIRDMARHDAALDNNILLRTETKTMMFAPTSSSRGTVFPHGLGWFSQDFHGTRLVWHFGWHPDHASALIVKVPEKGLSFMAFANTDMLSRPFNLLHGDVLNSPAALLFLKMIVFPGEDIPELEAKSSETSEIVLKASGRKPVVVPFELAILGFCLLVFLSAPILWAVLRIRGKLPDRTGSLPFGRNGPAAVSIKAFALLCVLLGLMVMGVLLRAPFLVYWPELPGWIDGVSDAENIALVLPTILAVLAAPLCLLAVWAWRKEYWSVLERIHFTVLAATTAGFALLLDHWHLVGLSYYWNYLLR